MNVKSTWRMLAAASVTVATLIGCSNEGGIAPPLPPPTAAQNPPFSVFVQTVFAADANSTPVPINSVVFNFDVNDEPTAFDALIAGGSFQ